MRLHVESSIVGSTTTVLSVTGIVDWSTLAQFRASLSKGVSHPRSDVLVDLTGMLSWSSEAQAVLVRANRQAHLLGGRLAVVGLAPIPSLQAKDFGLYKVLDLFPSQEAALAAMADRLPAPRPSADDALVRSR